MSRASPRPVPETRRGTRSPHTSPACLPSSVRRLRPQSWQAPKCPVQAGAGATPGDTQPTHRPVPGAQHVGAEDTQHGAPLTSPPTTPRRAPRDDFPAAGLPVNRSRSGLAFSLACPEFGPTRWEYRPFTSICRSTTLSGSISLLWTVSGAPCGLCLLPALLPSSRKSERFQI